MKKSSERALADGLGKIKLIKDQQKWGDLNTLPADYKKALDRFILKNIKVTPSIFETSAGSFYIGQYDDKVV